MVLRGSASRIELNGVESRSGLTPMALSQENEVDDGYLDPELPSSLPESPVQAAVREFSSTCNESECVIQTHVNEDGTTSNYFDKRKLKIAPRSTLQFKVGPPFEHINTYTMVTDTETGLPIDFKIIPRIDRGFDFIDDEWVGYKRNYFTLVASFLTLGLSLNEFLGGSYTLSLPGSCNENMVHSAVRYFAIRIKARSDDDQSEIALVQHTAKRDKGPQFAPATCALIPSSLPRHQIIREASNVRNSTKMQKYDSTFYFHRDQESGYSATSVLSSYPDDCIQKVARYERVQFASSINVKNPNQKNRHFRLHVMLGAIIQPTTALTSNHLFNPENSFNPSDLEEISLNDGTKGIFIPLQEARTPPLIIRGRSPSNYTNSQRASMRAQSSISNPSACPSQAHCASSIDSKVKSDKVSPAKPFSSNSNTKIQFPKQSLPKKDARPAKRGSKVVELNEYGNKEVQSDSNYSQNPKKAKRVETLDQIQESMGESSPLTPIDVNFSKEGLDRSKMYKEEIKESVYHRQCSIDLKDIELKPSLHMVYDENVYFVGSLVMKRRMLMGPASRRKGKQRKLNNTGTILSSVKNISHLDVKPKQKSSASADTSTILDNTLDFQHMSDNGALDADAIPRLFSNVIGENSFMTQFKDVMEKNVGKLDGKKLDVLSNLEFLPSEIASAGELFEELSFYRA